MLDTDSGELVEEGRLRTTPEDLRRRFDSEEQLQVAVEVGTHSSWVNRILEGLGHEVLVANPRKTRLIYGLTSVRPISSTLRSWRAWPG